MFCFSCINPTHGSSVCIRVHFNSHISVSLTLFAWFITPFVIIVTLTIVVIVHNCFFFLCLSVQLVICNGTFYNICEEAAFTSSLKDE